uniref:Peptidase M20 dimerisation domain-containing protein n=1 Tax=Wuchereria bancrofti TaxID=6293 RepID=A0A1I8EQK6_WUCBA
MLVLLFLNAVCYDLMVVQRVTRSIFFNRVLFIKGIDPHYQCAAKAIQKVYGIAPDYIREGDSIPVTTIFQEMTRSSVLLLPIGSSDDMAHSQNERINLVNYMDGIKLLGALHP